MPAAAVVILGAWGAASASAAVRWADPAGTGTQFSSCSEFTIPQCSIEGAIDGAVGGDEVILRPGTYMTTEGLDIDAGFDVHGQDGQPTPTVTWAASPVDNDPIFNLIGPGGGKLRNVIVDSSRANNSIPSALLISDPAAVVDGVFAHFAVNAGGISFACKVEAGTIRDSVCWNSAGSGNAGLGTFVNDTLTRSATLRNVTAVATSTNSHGIYYDQINNTTGGTVSIDAKSVIAIGSGTGAAIHAGANSPSTVTIALDHSLYASEEESNATATITDPGSGTNIFGPALLSADFHQLAGSPSIDAGAIDGSSGSTDIDREARVQGAAADIGADEFVPAPAGGGGSAANDTLPPITTLAKGPKKRTKKHKAKFQFVSNEPGSTFMCKLDKKAFAACSAPKSVKVKTGKHTFKVEAIDPAGNIDATPAVFHWKVLPK